MWKAYAAVSSGSDPLRILNNEHFCLQIFSYQFSVILGHNGQILDQATNFVFGRNMILLSGGSASKGLGASTALLMLTTTINHQDVNYKLYMSDFPQGT